jgi:two-component system, chemotaxis family, sensor histidine kinase and response regulator WspE
VFVPLADPALLELFREEVRAHAAALNAGLLELEREPANPQRIEPLMRAAHSLKGAARIVGLDPAVQLAHELEDAFVAAQAGRVRLSSDDIDLFLRGADLLAELGEGDLAHWAATRHAEVSQLRLAITAITNGETAASTISLPSPLRGRGGNCPKPPAPPSRPSRSCASPPRASTAS